MQRIDNLNWLLKSSGWTAISGRALSSPRTARALIPLLLLAALALTACGGLKPGGAQIPRPDTSLTAPCARPENHLGAGDWEIMAGRIGDDLIRCGQEKEALAAYINDVIGAK